MTYAELIAKVSNIIQDSSFSDIAIGEYLNQAQDEVAGGMLSRLGNWITPPLPGLFTIGTITTDSITPAYSTYPEIKTLLSVNDTIVFTYNEIEISVLITNDYTTLQTDINDALVTADYFAGNIIVSWEENDLILTCSGIIKTDTITDGLYTDIDTLNTINSVDTALVKAAAYVSMPSNFQRSLQFAASSSGYEINIAASFIDFSETYPLLDQIGRISEVAEFGNNLYYQGIPPIAENLTLHYYRAPINMVAENDTPDGIPLHLQSSLLINHAVWKIFDLIEDDFTDLGLNTQRYQAKFYDALQNLELFIPYEARGMALL